MSAIRPLVGMSFALLVVHFVTLHNALSCHTGYSCASTSINETSSIECYGYFSCAYATLIDSTGFFYCYGAYSCYQALLIQHTEERRVGGRNIICNGLYSCAMVNYIHNFDGNLACGGELSCFQSNISLIDSDARLLCYGDRSCAQTSVETQGLNFFYGHLSGQNAMLYSQDVSVTYNFYGANSGDGATIFCGNGHTCIVECYSNACNNLNLTCMDGIGTCTFSVDCQGAEFSVNCPDGYHVTPLSSFMLDIDFESQLSNTVMSSYNNSVNQCYDNINAINCGDYQDGRCSNQLVYNNIGPVCCSGSISCDNSVNITSNGNDTNAVAIRCDGNHACDLFLENILGINGGNMYFSGLYATLYYNNDVRIATTDSYDIFCTGGLSCQRSIFENGNNLYCAGYQACASSLTVIRSIPNVWMLTFAAGEGVTMIDIAGNVYCASYWACRHAKISNVDGIVYGTGDGALYLATMRNVSYLFCGGIEACMLSTIKGIRNIQANGQNALGSTTIISEIDKDIFGIDRTLNVAINGNYTYPINIYCNATDICQIECQSTQACSTMNVYCDGCCFVNCDASNDIECPSLFGNYFNWTYSNFSFTDQDYSLCPTLSPTNLPTQKPTSSPTLPTNYPTVIPTAMPTGFPTSMPSNIPTKNPSYTPGKFNLNSTIVVLNGSNTHTTAMNNTSDDKRDHDNSENTSFILEIVVICCVVFIVVACVIFLFTKRKKHGQQELLKLELDKMKSMSESVDMNDNKMKKNKHDNVDNLDRLSYISKKDDKLAVDNPIIDVIDENIKSDDKGNREVDGGDNCNDNESSDEDLYVSDEELYVDVKETASPGSPKQPDDNINDVVTVEGIHDVDPRV